MGYAWGFRAFGLTLAAWLAIFAIRSRNAPSVIFTSLRESISPLGDVRSWQLCLCFFLTFGFFVSMASYLPTLFTEEFHRHPGSAGTLTAGFVLLAAGIRPVGGWISDRFGGRRVLGFVFPVMSAMALLLTSGHFGTFLTGTMVMAIAAGIGNSAVFKLVPHYFPQQVGAVIGLVGAAGALGGVLPPLILGALKQYAVASAHAFVLLGLFSILCFLAVRSS